MFDPLFIYFEEQWMKRVTPGSFLVFGQSRRANNCQESFHHSLFEQVGRAHPNIWTFTTALQSICETEIRNSLRSAHGDPISRPRKRTWILQDREIRKNQEAVMQNRISVYEFLRAMSYRFNTVPCATVSSEVNENLASLTSEDLPDLDLIDLQETQPEDDSPAIQLNLVRTQRTARQTSRGHRAGRRRSGPSIINRESGFILIMLNTNFVLW